MRMMSPGCEQVVAADPRAAPTTVPLRLSRSRRIHWSSEKKDLGVAAAAALVLDDDLVGRRAADRHRLAGHQPEHVGPFRAFANDQIRKHRPRSLESADSRPSCRREWLAGPCRAKKCRNESAQFHLIVARGAAARCPGCHGFASAVRAEIRRCVQKWPKNRVADFDRSRGVTRMRPDTSIRDSRHGSASISANSSRAAQSRSTRSPRRCAASRRDPDSQTRRPCLPTDRWPGIPRFARPLSGSMRSVVRATRTCGCAAAQRPQAQPAVDAMLAAAEQFEHLPGMLPDRAACPGSAPGTRPRCRRPRSASPVPAISGQVVRVSPVARPRRPLSDRPAGPPVRRAFPGCRCRTRHSGPGTTTSKR